MKRKAWDVTFAGWIAQARATGCDPNDVGDVEWSDDPLKLALEEHYLPHVSPESTVLELGPGTGRMTRHVIGRCREMILVDYSKLVVSFLGEYLKGKGAFRIYQINKPAIPMVEDQSIDVVLANGVFEHLDVEEALWFLDEFFRVLRPMGVVVFNFDNLLAEEAVNLGRQWRKRAFERLVFRVHHAEAMRALAGLAGFPVLRVSTGHGRLAYIELQR